MTESRDYPARPILAASAAVWRDGKVLLGAEGDREGMPLLQNRYQAGKTLIYLCKDYHCMKPVEYISEIANLI